MNSGDKYWFAPKTYGYGAAPTHWKGWALIGVYVAVVVALPWILIVIPAFDGESFSFARFALWFGIMVASTWALVRITRKQTDGPWRWRWGPK